MRVEIGDLLAIVKTDSKTSFLEVGERVTSTMVAESKRGNKVVTVRRANTNTLVNVRMSQLIHVDADYVQEQIYKKNN